MALGGRWTSLCHPPSPQLPHQLSAPEHPWPLAPAQSCSPTWIGHLHSHSEWQQGWPRQCAEFLPWGSTEKVTVLCSSGDKGIRVVVWFVPGHGVQAAYPYRPFRRDRRQPQQQTMRSKTTGSQWHCTEHSLPSSCPLTGQTALSDVSRLGGASHHQLGFSVWIFFADVSMQQ